MNSKRKHEKNPNRSPIIAEEMEKKRYVVRTENELQKNAAEDIP